MQKMNIKIDIIKYILLENFINDDEEELLGKNKTI